MEMKHTAQILVLFFALATTGATAEERALARPNWDRDTAVGAIDEERVQGELTLLFRHARSGHSAKLMREVKAIAEGRDRPAPERDRILFQLAAALGELEPQTIEPEIIDYLSTTRSWVLVAHEDHPELGVPLYNIRAAASGSLQTWNHYGKQDRKQDVRSLLQALSSADSTVTAAQLRQARAVLDPGEIETVLLGITHIEKPGVAAMMLAELAPDHLERPAVTRLLFDLLDHRQLGSTAGLLLAKSGNPVIIDRLAETATLGTGLEAGRAQSALETVSKRGER